jgi:hypothetical protein
MIFISLCISTCMWFVIFPAVAAGGLHDHIPYLRLQPGLNWCDSHPIVRMLNKTHILELEKSQWLLWDSTSLQRNLKMAKEYGKGIEYYLTSNGQKRPHMWRDDIDLERLNECGIYEASKSSKKKTGHAGFMSMFAKKEPELEFEGGAHQINGLVRAFETVMYPMDPFFPCPTPLKTIGDSLARPGDTAKILCAPDVQFDTPDCVIYSLGSNNLFDFEEDIAQKFSQCKIYTFDCTSNPPLKPITNVVFDKTCLGDHNNVIDSKQFHTLGFLMKKYNHKFIQLLKMDIEGFEMEVFASILQAPYSKSLPFQLSFETHHYQVAFQSFALHSALFQQLKLAGYRPVSYANNVRCPSCNEHTFVRVYC